MDSNEVCRQTVNNLAPLLLMQYNNGASSPKWKDILSDMWSTSGGKLTIKLTC